MKLRFLLISIFFALVLVPLILFRAWPHSAVLESELNEVHERHLLIARNLAAALERYHRDLTSTFELLLSDIHNLQDKDGVTEILDNLSFRHVCVANVQTGEVVNQIAPKGTPCPKVIPTARLNHFKALARSEGISFGPVTQSPDGQNVMHMVTSRDGTIAIGAIYTSYFIELGSAVSFGVRGHAAIVDHEGNVLSHPLESWIAARKNIAKVSAVQMMLEGGTGVETFYSPALKDDMIAGYAAVKGAGWGVMIPQPVSELHEKADHARQSAIVVMLFGALSAGLVALWISLLIARPIEWISTKAREVAGGNLNVPMTAPASRFMPIEMRAMQTDFQNMVRHLQEARDVRATFISSMSHELRTPLNAVIGFAEFTNLELDGPVPKVYKEYSGYILSAGKTLLQNIDDLLDVQRLESGKMNWEDARFSVQSLFKNAEALCKSMEKQDAVSIVWQAPKFELDVFTDKGRVCQCITNLVANAVKFTDVEGNITISAELGSRGDLEICVADTGIGISPSDLDRIQHPFEQVGNGSAFQRNDGLGLGLSIVRGILSKLDGQLSIESELGVGTRATIKIPETRLYVDGHNPEDFVLSEFAGAA